MSEQAHENLHGVGDDVRTVESNGELVHWMAAKPLRIGPAGISAAAAGAFVLGAAAAVAALGLMHMLRPARELQAPGRRLIRRAF